jgi:hypothetical protein
MVRNPAWSAKEDAICLKMTPSEASELLPGRSIKAIAQHRHVLRLRREEIALGKRVPRRKVGLAWSAEEDAICLKMIPSQAVKLLPNRTFLAIAQHRHLLRHPQKKGSSGSWTAKEVAILRREWPTASHVRELMALLPDRDPFQIRAKASQIGVKRLWLGEHGTMLTGHKEILDQIVMRAKADGIALNKLDKILKTGCYFAKSNYRVPDRAVKLLAVARAVEFFGGTLVIDWRDR